MNFRTYYLLFSALLLVSFVSAQRRLTDSLFLELKKGGHDTTVTLLNNLIGEKMFDYSPDSAMIFWQKAEQRCLAGIKKSEGVELLFYKRNLAEAFNSQGAYYLRKGEMDKTKELWDKSIAIRRETRDKYGIALSLLNTGFLYFQREEFPAAIDLWSEAEKISIEIGNFDLAYSAGSSLAGLYASMGDYKRSEQLFDELLAMKLKQKNETDLGILYYNLGASASENGKEAKALSCFTKARQLLSAKDDVSALGNVYEYLVEIYLEKKEYDSALVYLNSCKEIYTKMGYKSEIARNHKDFCRYYRETGNGVKAEEEAKASLKIGEEVGSQKIRSEALIWLSRCAVDRRDFESAYRYYTKAVQLEDSIRQKNDKSESLQKQLRASYEKEKIANNKEQQRVQALAAQESKFQRYIIFGIGAGFVLLAIFSFLLFSRFRLIKHQKEIIEGKSAEVRHQKELVEEKQKEILDSIRYAKRIQQSLLTSEKYVERSLKELRKKNT